jgi:hypothetical protein
MKKLLLVLAGFGAFSATAQEVRADLGRSAEMYTATHADGIPYNTSSNKSSSAVMIGTAPNVYGMGFGPKTNIWADEDLNTVVYLHRSDYGSNGDYSSGSLRFDYSTNGGSSWTQNAGPVYNPNLSGYAYPGFARYPHVGILNQSGNTNPLNASISVWAPTLAGTNAASWGGALMGTHKMDNTTTNMHVDTTGGHLTLENSYVDGGNFWGLSLDHPDYTTTEYTDTALVWKGTMDWSTDSMTFTEYKAYLPITDEAANGKIYGDGRIFFAANGTTGYISVEGYDSSIAASKVIHPILVKTTDGGATWGASMGPDLDLLVDNGSGDSLVAIFDLMTGGTWDIGHLTSSTRGHDLAVDANGNPHLFIHVFPGTGTTPSGGTAAPDFNFFPGVNLLVDVFTTDGGITWECNIITQVFTFDFDFDPTNGPVNEANRPYISMNADRDMMFFSWFETDTTFSSGTTDNQFPDWRCQGYNVMGDSLEGPQTVMGTYGDATWGSVADWAFDNGDGTYQLHMAYAPIEDFGTFSVLSPIDIYYLGQPYPNNIGIEEVERNNFSVSQNYPNPTDGLTKVAIESVEATNFNLTIIDLTGRVIAMESLGKLDAGRHIHTIDASNFAPGIYFYTVSAGELSITKKLIVE